MEALRIKDVTIEYKDRDRTKRAVENLSFDVFPGEVFGLLGPNGAGKTSLISCITSLNTQYSGEISIFRQRVGSHEAKLMVGLVPQELVSYGYFALEEVLHFHAGYFGVENPKEQIEFLLDKLQLKDQRRLKVAQLSGGMKRRFLIAKALVHKPKLLLLDEPSAGVDVELRSVLWDFVKELNRSGVTILLTTHYLEEAERLCDRVAVIHQGHLLACDRTQSLINQLQGRRVMIKLSREFTVDRPVDKDLFIEYKQEGRHINLSISEELKMAELLRRIGISLGDIEDIKTEQGRLEDAFLKLIANETTR